MDYDTESNVFMELLLTLLPFVLIIGIWIYLMRRMSGGGAGGAGGQIFNIGKSKAKLFDEKTDTRTTFKDVAGLEGAKEEVEEIIGGKPPKPVLGEQPVAVIKWVDGTLSDVVRQAAGSGRH